MRGFDTDPMGASHRIPNDDLGLGQLSSRLVERHARKVWGHAMSAVDLLFDNAVWKMMAQMSGRLMNFFHHQSNQFLRLPKHGRRVRITDCAERTERGVPERLLPTDTLQPF